MKKNHFSFEGVNTCFFACLCSINYILAAFMPKPGIFVPYMENLFKYGK